MSTSPEYVSLEQLVARSTLIVVAKRQSPPGDRPEVFELIKILYAEAPAPKEGSTLRVAGAYDDLFRQIEEARKRGEPTPMPILPTYRPSLSLEEFRKPGPYIL